MLHPKYAGSSEDYNRVLKELIERAKVERENSLTFTPNFQWVEQQKEVQKLQKYLTDFRIWHLLESIREALFRDTPKFKEFQEKRKEIINQLVEKVIQEREKRDNLKWTANLKWISEQEGVKKYHLTYRNRRDLLRSVKGEVNKFDGTHLDFLEARPNLMRTALEELKQNPELDCHGWTRDFLKQNGFETLSENEITHFVAAMRSKNQGRPIQEGGEFVQALMGEAAHDPSIHPIIQEIVENTRTMSATKQYEPHGTGDARRLARAIQAEEARQEQKKRQAIKSSHQSRPVQECGKCAQALMGEATHDPSIHSIIQEIVENTRTMSATKQYEPDGTENERLARAIQADEARQKQEERQAIKSSVLQLENELIKELVKKIENFSQREGRTGHGARFTGKAAKPEERIEKEDIIHQIKNLMPEGMLLLNEDLHSAILAPQDPEIFKSFVEKLTEAIKILKSAQRSQQLLHQLLNSVEKLECLMEDELNPLLLAMVERASTPFEIQKLLEILQKRSKQLTPDRVKIINVLRSKIQQTPDSRELKTRFVHLIDQYIAEILNILANEDEEHQRLKKQLSALPQLIDATLREWQSGKGNLHWDKAVCDIAEELKQYINQKQRDGKAGDAPVIPPKTLGEAVNAIHERISNPEIQRKFIKKQTGYLPQRVRDKSTSSKTEQNDLDGGAKMVFIAALPNTHQEEIYVYQPQWRSEVEKITKKRNATLSTIFAGSQIEITADNLLEELEAGEEREALELPGNLRNMNERALQESSRSLHEYRLPNSLDQVEAAWNLHKIIQEYGTNENVPLEEIMHHIENVAKQVGPYAIQRLGDGTPEGLLYYSLIGIIMKRHSKPEERLNAYMELRKYLNRKYISQNRSS
ncbi:MAG: hypothetical protein C5B47_01485 [Verrucomicrobia bacterium]|nr:MAG: hypothetical protein C5B47_01485 [Verrucomicrobiota bacterium]